MWWIGYRLVPSPRVSSEPLSGPTIASQAVPARVTQFHGLGPTPHLTREKRTTRDSTGRAGTPRGSLIMLRSEVRFFLAPPRKTWSESLLTKALRIRAGCGCHGYPVQPTSPRNSSRRSRIVACPLPRRGQARPPSRTYGLLRLRDRETEIDTGLFNIAEWLHEWRTVPRIKCRFQRLCLLPECAVLGNRPVLCQPMHKGSLKAKCPAGRRLSELRCRAVAHEGGDNSTSRLVAFNGFGGAGASD